MIKLRPACLLLCILCHNYVYTGDVSESQPRYTTQYTNEKQVTTIPQISDSCLEDDSISSKICSCTQNLHKSKIISLAGCDEQINEIIKDIQSQNIKKDITIMFYLYKNGKLYYLGSSTTSLEIFEMVLRKYNHCICINEDDIHKFHEAHTGWGINDIILVPSHKETLMLDDLVNRYGNNVQNKYLDYDLIQEKMHTSESSQDNNEYQTFNGHLKDDVNNFAYHEYDMPTKNNLVSPADLINNEEISPTEDGNDGVFDLNLGSNLNQICRNNWYDPRNSNNVLQASIGNVNFNSGNDKGLTVNANFNRYTETTPYDNSYYSSINSIGSPADVEIFDGDLSAIAQIPTQLSKSLPLYHSISSPANYFEQKICKFNKPASDLYNSYENYRPYQGEITDSKVYYFNGETQHYTSSNINTIIPIKSTSLSDVFANTNVYNEQINSDISQTSNAANIDVNYNYNLDSTTVKSDILKPSIQFNSSPSEVNINNPTQQELINGSVVFKENNIFSNNLPNYYHLHLKPVDYKGKNINIDMHKDYGPTVTQQELVENHQLNNNWLNYYLNLKPVNYEWANINKKHIPNLTRQRPTNENVFFTENLPFNNWKNYYLNIKPANYKDIDINIGLAKGHSPALTRQKTVNKNIIFTGNNYYNKDWTNDHLNLKPVHYKGMNININLYQNHKNPPKTQNPDCNAIYQNRYMHYKPCNWYNKYINPNLYGFFENGYNFINTYDHIKNKCYEFDLSRQPTGTRDNLVNSKNLQSTLIIPSKNNKKSRLKLRNFQSYQNDNQFYSFPSQNYKTEAISTALFTRPNKPNGFSDGTLQPCMKYKSNIPKLDMSQNIQNQIYPIQNKYYPVGNQNYYEPALASPFSVKPVRYYPSYFNYKANTLPQSYAQTKINIPMSDIIRVPQDKPPQINVNPNEYNPKVCQYNYEPPSVILPLAKISDITQNNIQNQNAISQPFAHLMSNYPKQFISPPQIPSYDFDPKLFENPATVSPVLHSNNYDNQPGLISNTIWPNFARLNAKLPKRQNDNLYYTKDKVFNRPTASTARLIENNANDNNISKLKSKFISQPSTHSNIMLESLNKPQYVYSNAAPNYYASSIAPSLPTHLNYNENICKSKPKNTLNDGLTPAPLVTSVPTNTVPLYSSKVEVNNLHGPIAVISDKPSGYSLNDIPGNTIPFGQNYYVPGNKFDSIFKLSDKSPLQNYTPYVNLFKPNTQNLIAQAATDKHPYINANNLLAFPVHENYNNFGNIPSKQKPWPSYSDKFKIISASYLPTGGTKTNIFKTKPQLDSTQLNYGHNSVPFIAQTPYLSQFSHTPDMRKLIQNKNYYDPNNAAVPTNIYNADIPTKIPCVDSILPQQYLTSASQPKTKTAKILAHIPQITPLNSNTFWNRPYKLESIPDVQGTANKAAYNLSGPQNNNINMPFILNPKNNYYSDIPSHTKSDELINKNEQQGFPIKIKDTLKNRVNLQNLLPNVKYQPTQWSKTPAVFNFEPFLKSDGFPKTDTPADISPYLPKQNPYFNVNNARPFGSLSRIMPSIPKSPYDGSYLNTLSNPLFAPQTQPYIGFPNLKPTVIFPGFKSQNTAHSYPSTATYSSPSSYSSPTPYLPKQNPYYSVCDNKAFKTKPHVITNRPYISPNFITLPNLNKAQTQRNFADLIKPCSSSRSQNIAHPGPSTATLPSPTSDNFQIPSYIPQIQPSKYSPQWNTFPGSGIKSPVIFWPSSSFEYPENTLEPSRKAQPRQYILDLSQFSPRYANRKTYKPQSSVNTWPCFNSHKFNYPLDITPKSLPCTNWKGSIKSQSNTIPRISSPDTLNTPRFQLDYSNIDSSTRLPNKNIQSQPDLSLLAFQKPYQRQWPSLNMIKPQSPTIIRPYLNPWSSVYPSYTQQTQKVPNLIKPITSITNRHDSSLHTWKYPSVIAPKPYPCNDFGKTSPCVPSTKPNSISTRPIKTLDRIKPSSFGSLSQPYSSNYAYYNSPKFSVSPVIHLPSKPYSQEIPLNIPYVQPWTETGDLTVPWSYPEFYSLNTNKPELFTTNTPATDRSHNPSYISPQSPPFKYSSNFPTNIWPQSYSFNFKPFTGFSVPQSTIMPEFSTLNKKIPNFPVTNRPHSYSFSTKYPQFNTKLPQSTKFTTFSANLQSPAKNNIGLNLLTSENPQSFTIYPEFVQPSQRFANLNTVTPKLQTSTMPYSAFYSTKYPSNITPLSLTRPYFSDVSQPFELPKYKGQKFEKPKSTVPIYKYSSSSLIYPSNIAEITQPKLYFFDRYYPLREFKSPNSQYGVDISDFANICKSPELYHRNANKPQSSTTAWPYHTAECLVKQTITSPLAKNEYLGSYNARLKFNYPKTMPAPFVFNFNKYDSYQAPISVPNTILKYSYQHPINNSDRNFKKINRPLNSFPRPYNKFGIDISKLISHKPPLNEAIDNNINKHLRYKTPISLETSNIYPIISSNIGTGTLNVLPYSLQTNQGENYESPNNHELRAPLPIKFDNSPKIRNSISKPNLVDDKYTFDTSKYFPKASQFVYGPGFPQNYNSNNVQKLDHPSPNYRWQSLPKINQPFRIPNVYEGKTILYPDQVHFASNIKMKATPDNLHLAFKPFKNLQDTINKFLTNPFNKPIPSEFYKMTSFPGICNLQVPKVQSPTTYSYQYIHRPNVPHNTAKIETKPFVLNKKVFKPTAYTATNNNVGIGTMYKTQMYSQKHPQIDNYDTEKISNWNRPHFELTPKHGSIPNLAQTPCILNRYPGTTSNYFRPHSYGSNLASLMNGPGEYMPKLSSLSKNVNPQISQYLSSKFPNQYTTRVSSRYKSPLGDSSQQYISYKATLQPSTMEHSPSKIIIPSVNYLSNKKYSNSYTIPKPRTLNQRFNYNMLNQPYQAINTNTGRMTYSPTIPYFNTKLEKSETTSFPCNNDAILNQGYTNIFNFKPCSKTNYAINNNLLEKMSQATDNKIYKQPPSEIQYSFKSGVMSNNYNPISAFNSGPKNTSYKSSYPNIYANNYNYLRPRPNHNNQYKLPNLCTDVTNKPEIIFNEPQVTAKPAYNTVISKLNPVSEIKIPPLSIQNSYRTPCYPRNWNSPLNTANEANVVPYRNSHPCQPIYSISKGAVGFTPCSYSKLSTPVYKSTAGLANLAFTPPFLYSSHPQSSNIVPTTNFNSVTLNLYPTTAAQTAPTSSSYSYNWNNYKPNIKLQNNILRYPSTSPCYNGIAHFIKQYTPFTENNDDPTTDVNAERFAINNLLKCHPQNKINNDCQIAGNLLKDKHVDVDVGNVCLVKHSPDCCDNTYIVPTKKPGIFMKAWKTKMKIIKARVVFDESECGVTNFMPIVKDPNKFDFGAVQDVVKDLVTQAYGEPVVLKGEYKVYNPYSIICNIDCTKLNPGTSILWPTLDENII